MFRICAWCEKPLGWKPGKDILTHGICLACAALVFPEEMNLLKPGDCTLAKDENQEARTI